MRSSLILVIPLLAALMSGCFHGPVSNKGFLNDLVIEIWANTNCVDPGNTVSLHASVSNNGPRTEIAELPDRPVFDLCVEADGGYKKCWSDGKPLIRDLTRLELKPGASRSLEMNWVAESIGEYGAGATYVFSSNTGGSQGANVTIGVGAGRCPGEGMR